MYLLGQGSLHGVQVAAEAQAEDAGGEGQGGEGSEGCDRQGKRSLEVDEWYSQSATRLKTMYGSPATNPGRRDR